MRERGGDGGLLVERSLAREHFEADDPKCIEVARARHRPPHGLLWREVLRRPHDFAGARVSRAVGRSRDAKVGQLGLAFGRDEDVGRLDVAVDDTGLVSRGEREGALTEDEAHLLL